MQTKGAKKMKKIVCIALLFTMLLGCSSETSQEQISDNNIADETQQTENTDQIEEKNDEDLFSLMETQLNALYPISEKITMAAEYIGGIEGIKFKTENFNVEIYKFDTSSEAYKLALDEGKLNLEGFGQFDCVINGEYAMSTSNLPEDVIELFKSL